MHGILLRGSNDTQSSRQNTLKDFSRLDGVYFSFRISKDSSWIKSQNCLECYNLNFNTMEHMKLDIYFALNFAVQSDFTLKFRK